LNLWKRNSVGAATILYSSEWISGTETFLELNRSSGSATGLDCPELDLWHRNSVGAEQEL
jgi:hypothetical protein